MQEHSFRLGSIKEVVMGEGLFQPLHLLVIAFIALLVFGPKKLPELGKGLGDGIRAFKEGMKEPENTTAKSQENKNS
jgi:sec-independent protein translocase protein TatA